MPRKTASRAKRQKRARSGGVKTWLLRHAQMAVSSLGRLSRRPVATMMTALVIGIALALPAGLHLLMERFAGLSGSWEGSASISLFLDQSITDEDAEQVWQQISQRADVADARLIDRAAALEEFQRLSGFGDAIALLDENPLPAVVLIRPAAQVSGTEAVAALAEALAGFREIERAQVDLRWVERLGAIIETIDRAVLILGGLLCAAVLLVVGNTIRLEIQNRHHEIEIVKLVGGTNAFIRRPFLYEGLWYGLFGSALALALVVTALHLLDGPVQRLAGLYASDVALGLPKPGLLLALLATGPLLGLAGSWLAVGQHIADVEPE